MIEINCGFEDDFRRAYVSAPYQLVGQYLENDIQDCIEECKFLLSVCDQVEKGDLNEWGGCGNANQILIQKNAVLIKVMFTEEKVSLCLNDYRLVVRAWVNFLLAQKTR